MALSFSFARAKILSATKELKYGQVFKSYRLMITNNAKLQIITEVTLSSIKRVHNDELPSHDTYRNRNYTFF